MVRKRSAIMSIEGPPLGETQVDRPTSRDALYRLVWSHPLRTLAAQFRMSDVGLAKACRRMKIPLPGRGYWRQKETGHPVRKPPLRPLSANAAPELQHFSPRIAEHPSRGATSTGTGPLADQRRFEADPDNAIRVRDTLTDPHPLVERASRSLRNAGTDDRGYLKPRTPRCLAIRTSKGALERALRIFDALAWGVEAREYALTLADRDGRPVTIVQLHGEEITIALEEVISQVERPAPKRKPSSFGYAPWQPRAFDSVPSGELSLRIDEPESPGVRKSWSDGKRQRVEECLNAFIVGLVAAALAKKAERERRDAQRRAWEEAERARQLEAQRRTQEAARRRVLREDATRWRDAETLRGYVRALRATLGDGPLAQEHGASLEAWLSWAESQADRLDPTTQVRSGNADQIEAFLQRVAHPQPSGEDYRY